MIRKIVILIFSSAIFMVGLFATYIYMEPKSSLSDVKTWVFFIIAYFAMFKPAMVYWNDKLTNG